MDYYPKSYKKFFLQREVVKKPIRICTAREATVSIYCKREMQKSVYTCFDLKNYFLCIIYQKFLTVLVKNHIFIHIKRTLLLIIFKSQMYFCTLVKLLDKGAVMSIFMWLRIFSEFTLSIIAHNKKIVQNLI